MTPSRRSRHARMLLERQRALSRSGRAVLQQSFRALRHRNFRLLFTGMGISWTGTWMERVAVSWLVYRLTGSALMLGVVSFASQFPSFIVAPLAGVFADRFSKIRIAMLTQALSMLQATLLATLILTGTVRVWHIVAVVIFLGIVSGFDTPARQSLLIELVEGPADLANAIALNSSLFNGARLIGPAVAGLMIAVTGEGIVIALNAASYIAVLWALLRIGIPRRTRTGATGPAILGQLREGFRYAIDFSPIRTILVLLAVMSLLAMPYTVLIPVFATNVLHGGPHTFGFLMSSIGLGALAGALYLASRADVRGLSQLILRAMLLFGVGLVGLSLSRSVPLSMVFLLISGFGMMTTSASCNTILQTVADPDKRGRVMSLYTMAFMGVAPFGSLVAGAVANRIGAPYTVLGGGIACMLLAAWFARERGEFRRAVRPVYVRLGIIPEVAEGLGAVTEIRQRS